LVIAHPDDEIFVSGTICTCIDKSIQVAVVCVTDGEGGETEMLDSGSAPSLKGLRRRELQASLAVLGVEPPRCLGFPDVAEPQAPGAQAWDQEKLRADIAALLAELRPDAILTHGPLGGYGNQAHRLVHRCVMEAARRTGFAGSIYAFCGRVPRACLPPARSSSSSRAG
jgi:N-acetyl-1-D-myo-inositol-2-amino-2-deoxy-alpha-D-glucopyranoside deacetylase